MPNDSDTQSNLAPVGPAPQGAPGVTAPQNTLGGVVPQRTAVSSTEAYVEVAGKIGEAHNILIALSSDPSVDEMAAAIGLSLYLDKLGKRATAIYSGATPNALEFLKPEETFESTADTLQDFVIALNKDKADHLRYKVDGDYVKIYITPYKTRIAEEDLDFSYGDFNVDLVLALDVANGIDLDSALREHGRIMHDAAIINITTGNPGKFGEIEWSDKSASSVSEMIAKMLYSVKSDVKVEKDEATAFLTGIVAATNRFSSASTTPETMRISSKLMESGANQQLISKNITPDMENEMFSVLKSGSDSEDNDLTNLDIDHSEESADESGEKSAPEEVPVKITEAETEAAEKSSTLLDDLKAAEASLAQAGAETTPDFSDQPVRIDGGATVAKEPELPPVVVPEPVSVPTPETESRPTIELKVEPGPEAAGAEPKPEPATESRAETEAKVEDETEAEPEPKIDTETRTETDAEVRAKIEPKAENGSGSDGEPRSSEDGLSGEKVIAPPTDMEPSVVDEDNNKYGDMLRDALAGLKAANPFTNNATSPNPAAMSAPDVASAPEVNGVPEMNYMPMPGEEILPPPPTPPIDMGAGVASAMPEAASAVVTGSTVPQATLQPAEPVPETVPTSLGSQPAMQDQVYNPQAADPAAFKIPGM